MLNKFTIKTIKWTKQFNFPRTSVSSSNTIYLFLICFLLFTTDSIWVTCMLINNIYVIGQIFHRSRSRIIQHRAWRWFSFNFILSWCLIFKIWSSIIFRGRFLRYTIASKPQLLFLVCPDPIAPLLGYAHVITVIS